MKYLYFLALLPLLFAACDNSNEAETIHAASYYVSSINYEIVVLNPENDSLYTNNVYPLTVNNPREGFFQISYNAGKNDKLFLFVSNKKDYDDFIIAEIRVDHKDIRKYSGNIKAHSSIYLEYQVK
jgi:hypothetical protein